MYMVNNLLFVRLKLFLYVFMNFDFCGLNSSDKIYNTFKLIKHLSIERTDSK